MNRYQVFAELMDLYIPTAVNYSGLHHPGYYYQAASAHQLSRRDAAFDVRLFLFRCEQVPTTSYNRTYTVTPVLRN